MDNIFEKLFSKAKTGFKNLHISGLKGSSKAFVVNELKTVLKDHFFLIITPSSTKAEDFFKELLFFSNFKPQNRSYELFPDWEILPFEPLIPHEEVSAKRIKTLFSFIEGNIDGVVCSIRAIIQKSLPKDLLLKKLLHFFKGKEINRDELLSFLNEEGYQRVSLVEEVGDISVRGNIIDIFSPTNNYPVRIELFGDTIESIRLFNPETQRSLKEIEKFVIIPYKEETEKGNLASLIDYLPKKSIILLDEPNIIEEETLKFWKKIDNLYGKNIAKRKNFFLPEEFFLPIDKFTQKIDSFSKIELEEISKISKDGFFFELFSNEDIREKISLSSAKDMILKPFSNIIKKWQDEGIRIGIVFKKKEAANRFVDLISYYSFSFSNEFPKQANKLSILVGDLPRGFRFPALKLAFITEEEIFGQKPRIRDVKRGKVKRVLTEFGDLKVNDYVVHLDYGIGIYKGLVKLSIDGVENEYMQIEYQGKDHLYIPVDQLNLVQKYIGGEDAKPTLDKLGTNRWNATKKRVKRSIEKIAKELLEIYASRQFLQGIKFSPPDQLFREFEAAFEFEETPDQSKAIQDVIKDMISEKPMDRLVCGDVGYGKTEVAIRAAFKAVQDSKQVAFLVPTTLLAEQHFHTIKKRVANYPIIVECLSRFNSYKEQKDIVKRVASGKIDIIIGTHRLLQKDISFKDLGLVIIDEEQRFGVIHKEKLKKLKKNVDVLTLTATPIPRTLHMSLTGIRDLSTIDTPPENRLSIKSFIVGFDDEIIRNAVLRELYRGGQIFFVHNRISSIEPMANYLKKLIPEARIGVAHGQMEEKTLSMVMSKFLDQEYDLLVTTNIIESGLDIPTANTILINQAHRFGLADLYQLRGRVGRAHHRAYAYFIVPEKDKLTRDAKRRLKAIQELTELGSGFRLALKDLEIRGAGNLLGKDQSGHIAAVGFEMYTQMMEKAVKELKGEKVEEKSMPEVRIKSSAFIPETYIPDTYERLTIYKRLSKIEKEKELLDIREELLDRFGRIPKELERLLKIVKLKLFLISYGINKVEMNKDILYIKFGKRPIIKTEKLVDWVKTKLGTKFSPDGTLSFKIGNINLDEIIEFLKKFLQELS